MRLAKGFDTSEFALPAQVYPDTFVRFKGEDYALGVFRGHSGYRVDNAFVSAATAAQKAGLQVATYVVVLPGAPALRVAKETYEAARGFWDDLQFVALDVEVETVSVADILSTATAIKTYGQIPVIYTRKGFWEQENLGSMGHEFGLWYAHWDGVPDFTDFEPFGGWTHADIIGKQYSGTVRKFGIGIDEDIFNLDAIEDLRRQRPDAVLEQIDRIANALLEIRAALAIVRERLARPRT